MSKLQFFKAREAEVAWIDARLDISQTKTEAMEVDEGKDLISQFKVEIFL